MIENLALRYNDTVGEEIAGLLSKLPHLSRLVVDGSINTEIAPFFSFGRHANSLRSFMYSCSIIQEIDCKDISNTLVAEMPNLTSLRLNLAMTTLLNFSDFQLMTIKELDICCRRLDGCLTLSQNVLSVTKLKLSTQTGSAEEIATVLNNFTNLNSLELDFFRNHDILFNATLMEALVGLNSLKYFSFFGAYYSKEKYTINEGEKSALVKVLVALKNVEKIKIEFCQQSYYDDDLVTAVNNLTVKRPQQNIQLIIPDDDFDNDLNDLYDTNYRENYSDGYSD
ncbi:hypothetical protein B4U80_12098 [Leptotrombidium deliense]|uniref:Uncharacterized protein n=1 Tax=Leptotrombidium deliense TaxID=299467 RepID=A0A443RYE3_9ACAR|nr:hypothetical protein B4U80_12098 [Leptotrombidium deliense]